MTCHVQLKIRQDPVLHSKVMGKTHKSTQACPEPGKQGRYVTSAIFCSCYQSGQELLISPPGGGGTSRDSDSGSLAPPTGQSQSASPVIHFPDTNSVTHWVPDTGTH